MICKPCRTRADREPIEITRLSDPEPRYLRLGCSTNCGDPGCSCQHRGESSRKG